MARQTGSTTSRKIAKITKKSTLKSRQARQKEQRAETHASTTQHPPAGVQSTEPENPYLAGAGDGQQRELLSRNVKNGSRKGRKPEAQPRADTPAGLHATGTSLGSTKK